MHHLWSGECSTAEWFEGFGLKDNSCSLYKQAMGWSTVSQSGAETNSVEQHCDMTKANRTSPL